MIRDKWFQHVGGLEGWRLDRMLVRAEAAIDQLEAVSSSAAVWNALTPAQRQENTRLAIVAIAKISRLLLGRLEAE